MGIRRPFSNPKWQPYQQLKASRERKIQNLLSTWFHWRFKSEVAREYKGRLLVMGEGGNKKHNWDKPFSQKWGKQFPLNAVCCDWMESQLTPNRLVCWDHTPWDGLEFFDKYLLVTYCMLDFCSRWWWAKHDFSIAPVISDNCCIHPLWESSSTSLHHALLISISSAHVIPFPNSRVRYAWTRSATVAVAPQ